MNIELWLVPPAAHTALLRENYQVDGGNVVVTGRPHRRAHALHRDVLAAMGARDDVNGASSRDGAERELLLIRAWATAHRLNTLVIAHADMVNSPAWFGPLAEAVEGAGGRLVLVCDDNTGEQPVADWVESVGGHVTSHPSAAPIALTHTPDQIAPPIPTGMEVFPALLPKRAFYAFRATCRDVLPTSEFTAVDALYRDVFATFNEMTDPAPNAVTDALVDQIVEFSVPSQVVVAIRAAQAAFFTRGLLLSVDPGPAERAVRDRNHRALTDDEIRALRAYREPWIGVATVVRHMDLEYHNMRNMRLRNVDDDGRYTARGLKREPSESARVLFRAQRAVRLLEGAGAADRFLPQGPRDVADAIRRTKVDLNLPGLYPKKRRLDHDWATHMRVRVRPLSLNQYGRVA